VSLEDDLMRIFGSESMNKMLEKLGLKDGESIDHPWINKALERAQQKVEARNFDIRKTLIKFDNVLNDQRHVVFSQRKNAMNSQNIFDYSDEFLKEITDDIIKLKIQNLSNPKSNDFSIRLRQIVGKNFEEGELKEIINSKDDAIKAKITDKFLKSREDRIKLLGEVNAKDIEKRIFLQSIDLNWKSHIQYLEQLRQVIGLRSYGQRDPLVEYKKEAFDLFSNLLEKLKLDYVTILMNLKVETQSDKVANTQKKIEIDNNPKCLLILNKGKKISRNDRCEATGKKFKNCCGAL
jgi:preprotein translocase subunit SecA